MYILKNILRKIWKSKSRFLSLIFIVILGTSFFAGVRETSSDMLKTLDNYYDETNLYDFKIISTMGLTTDDIKAINELEGISIVEGNYSFDTLIDGNTVKISGLSEINDITLVSGVMPKNNNECLGEDGYFGIGDEITIDDDTYLKDNSCKIVGTINSSAYIYDNKGITTVGSGKLTTLLYVLKDNFKIDYYTEILILAENAKEELSYSDKYNEIIKEVNAYLQELKPLRETARYEEILKEAMDEIVKAQNELDKLKEDNESKFNEALLSLNSTKITLDENLEEYKSGLNSLNKTKEETESKINAGFLELNNAKLEFNNTLQSLNLDSTLLDSTLNNLNESISNLENILNSIDSTDNRYIEISNELENLKNYRTNIELLINTKNTLESEEEKLNNSLSTWNKEYNNALNELNSVKDKIDKGYKELDNAYSEYNTNYNNYLSEISKYEEEINNAKIEVNNIEKPVWYLLTRDDLVGFTSFYESATKVESIAAIFPIFFILIAFLMAFNTMNRMIEEERSEIGTFISLGIKKSTILFSYLIYVLLSSLIGLFIGLSFGYAFIPRILYTVYSASFTIPDLITYVNPGACTIIIYTTLILMSIVVIISLKKYFKDSPATILRGEAPKIGKKILLENIKPLWRHLSFSWKISFRNLFRYKKRIFMTVLGISGCTALLLTGFGIKDSLSDLIDIEYTDIIHYDGIFMLNDVNTNVDTILNNENIKEFTKTNVASFTFKSDNKNLDFSLISFLNSSVSENFITLKDLEGNILSIPDNGVIITEKMAELLNAKVGENISIRNSNNELFVVKISSICENYIGNYLFMNSTYYKEIFNNTDYNSYLVTINNDVNLDNLGANLLETDYFATIQYTKDNIEIFNDIIAGMNNIVYLIILFSSFLAITVLYNLTIININERKREIASLKVLGFNDREVSNYVYRETIIMTIIGIIVGLFLGNYLNTFILFIAETDEILFIKSIKIFSYILTFIIIVIFSIIVQIITHFILRRIDMIDSLKRVE